jgi:hypothetical protein
MPMSFPPSTENDEYDDGHDENGKLSLQKGKKNWGHLQFLSPRGIGFALVILIPILCDVVYGVSCFLFTTCSHAKYDSYTATEIALFSLFYIVSPALFGFGFSALFTNRLNSKWNRIGAILFAIPGLCLLALVLTGLWD